ncbi:MAG: hypothetical protein ABI120_12930, partial [Gemmatimonadaceae bacterium]
MSNAPKYRKKAVEYEQLKQFDRAVASYVRAIEENENASEDVDVALFNKVGDLTLRQGRVTEAVTYYERAVEHYVSNNLYDNAIALCNKILRNAPGRSNVYFSLGRICGRKGLRSDATRNFLEYATRMQQEGRVDEGMRALAEVADLMPELTEVRRLVEEHAARAGISLTRRRETPVRAVAQADADRVRSFGLSKDLVFLEIDYDAIKPVRGKTPPPQRSVSLEGDASAPAAVALVAEPVSVPVVVPVAAAPTTPVPAQPPTTRLEDLMIFDPRTSLDTPLDDAVEPTVVDGASILKPYVDPETPVISLADLEPTEMVASSQNMLIAAEPISDLLQRGVSPHQSGASDADEPVVGTPVKTEPDFAAITLDESVVALDGVESGFAATMFSEVPAEFPAAVQAELPTELPTELLSAPSAESTHLEVLEEPVVKIAEALEPISIASFDSVRVDETIPDTITVEDIPSVIDLPVVEAEFVVAPSVEAPFAETESIEAEFVEAEFVEAEFVEPEFVQPEFVEPDFVEPDFVQQQFVEASFVEPDLADVAQINEYSPDIVELTAEQEFPPLAELVSDVAIPAVEETADAKAIGTIEQDFDASISVGNIEGFAADEEPVVASELELREPIRELVIVDVAAAIAVRAEADVRPSLDFDAMLEMSARDIELVADLDVEDFEPLRDESAAVASLQFDEEFAVVLIDAFESESELPPLVFADPFEIVGEITFADSLAQAPELVDLGFDVEPLDLDAIKPLELSADEPFDLGDIAPLHSNEFELPELLDADDFARVIDESTIAAADESVCLDVPANEAELTPIVLRVVESQPAADDLDDLFGDTGIHTAVAAAEATIV